MGRLGGTNFLTTMQDRFVTEGGIRERMTAARLGYRTNQKELIEQLRAEIADLRRENTLLREELNKLTTQII